MEDWKKLSNEENRWSSDRWSTTWKSAGLFHFNPFKNAWNTIGQKEEEWKKLCESHGWVCNWVYTVKVAI